MVSAQVWNRSETYVAGLSTASPWATCSDATRDTALTLRRLVFSYQRSALGRSRKLPFLLF